jgi:hypothetical protein
VPTSKSREIANKSCNDALQTPQKSRLSQTQNYQIERNRAEINEKKTYTKN